MKNFGESADGRFVDYNECQLMLRRSSAKDDWNPSDKTTVDHDTPFGGCHTMRVLYYTDFQMNADGRHSKCVVPEQEQPTNVFLLFLRLKNWVPLNDHFDHLLCQNL